MLICALVLICVHLSVLLFSSVLICAHLCPAVLICAHLCSPACAAACVTPPQWKYENVVSIGDVDWMKPNDPETTEWPPEMVAKWDKVCAGVLRGGAGGGHRHALRGAHTWSSSMMRGGVGELLEYPVA